MRSCRPCQFPRRWARSSTTTARGAEDHAIVTIRFADRRAALIEASWAKPGGVDDKVEIFGSRGVSYADLVRGSALTTFSEVGSRVCDGEGT